MGVFLQKCPLKEEYFGLHLRLPKCIFIYIYITNVLNEWGSYTINVKSALFAKTGNKNVTAKWRVMNIYP